MMASFNDDLYSEDDPLDTEHYHQSSCHESASLGDLFSSSSSYNSSCKSKIVHLNDANVTRIHATHEKDDSAWNEDIRLFSPSTTSDSLCDADSDNNGSASFDDLFSSSSSYNSSCKSNTVHFNDDNVTTIHATHKKDDSAWNKDIRLFSPSITSDSSCDANSDNNGSASSSSDHYNTANDTINQNSSSLDNSSENKSLVKDVKIEIIASDHVHISKGEKIVVTCDIYSKTTCVINQKLVMPPLNKPKSQNRTRKDCPFKGCTAIKLLKLSNHLRQAHKLRNPSTIQKYLKLAKLNDKKAPAPTRTLKNKGTTRKFYTSPKETSHHTTTSTSALDSSHLTPISNNYSSRNKISIIDSDDSSPNSNIIVHSVINSSDDHMFDIEGFVSYLQTIAGGKKTKDVAKSIAADVDKFFNTSPHSSTHRYYDVLLNIENLYNYIKELQDVKAFAPTTVAEKLRRLQLAVDYTVAIENKEQNNDAMFVRCQRIIKHLEKWRHSLSKDITKQRMKHFITSEKEVKNAADPMEFCYSQVIQQRVTEILTSSTICHADYNIVISFLAAHLIFPNAQRPGIVKNMTVDEFTDRETISTDKTLIKVFQHKTVAARGPANVVISKPIENLMLKYHQGIRATIIPKPTMKHRFFLTTSGNEFRKVAETIEKVAKQYGLPMPTPCLHRKVIATAGQSALDDRDMRSLTSHMAHSSATSARFYQFPGIEPMKAALMHDTIQKLSNSR